MIFWMTFALILFLFGGLWLLVEMFRTSIWWGLFGILFPPVQWLFVLVNWGKAWRPLLLQLLAFILLLFAVFNSPDVRFQDYWGRVTQQAAAVLPAIEASSPVVPAVDTEADAAVLVESPAEDRTIFKCKDTRGRIAYSDKPCPGESQVLKSLPVSRGSASFECDGRSHCSQMTSCEEARFFLANCPGVAMNGNDDGVPCERQWCGEGL